MSNRSISIILPFYNAELFLPIFFDYYDKVNIDNKVELLMVDNGSTDYSKNIVQDYIKKNKNKNIRYIYFNDKASSYSARNYAIDKTQNEILVFTDSDCMPLKDWIVNIKNNIRQGMIISGNVEIQIKDEKNIWEVYDKNSHLNNKNNAKNGRVATANMAVYKVDFLKVGYFQERFSGGDHEWSMCAKEKELDIKFYDNVKVLHPSRKTYEEILNKERRIAYGVGMDYFIKSKKSVLLVIIYVMKVFNLKTNFTHSIGLLNYKININQIAYFNYKFIKIRFAQVKSALQGYKNINVRKLNIK